MEFRFETVYNHESLTAMARALRKVLRRKKSTIMRIFGLIVFAAGVYISTPLSGAAFKFEVRSLLSYIALILIFITSVWEDGINGFMAKKRLRPGTEEVLAIFDDEGYETKTEVENFRWVYQRINYLAETKYFFVLIFDQNHAQVFDKDELTGGTEDEFREFICKKTGKTMKSV